MTSSSSTEVFCRNFAWVLPKLLPASLFQLRHVCSPQNKEPGSVFTHVHKSGKPRDIWFNSGFSPKRGGASDNLWGDSGRSLVVVAYFLLSEPQTDWRWRDRRALAESALTWISRGGWGGGVRGRGLWGGGASQAEVKGQVGLAHLLPVHAVELVVHGDCEDVFPEPDTTWGPRGE